MNRKGGMEIRNAFADALPSPDWAMVTSGRLIVALMDVREWSRWLPDALTLLDPAETERVRRKRKTGDREALALAYGLHRLLLGHALEMDATAVPLWREESGRPRVGDDEIHTSLSHADTWVALAISGIAPVGVDVEPLVRADMLPEIADSICHPCEAAELGGLAPDLYRKALLALWVRKEAFLKAAGVGLSREMSSFLTPEGEVPLALEAGGIARLQMLEVDPACLIAVAGPPNVQAVFARLVPKMHNLGAGLGTGSKGCLAR